MTTWYLIADAGRARIFLRDADANISLVQQFDHPEGRAHPGDLTTDLGRTRQTGSASYAAERDERNARKEEENARFAKELADALLKGALSNAYEELVIASPPQFLGLIRPRLHSAVEGKLVSTLTKSLTELSEYELSKRGDIFEIHNVA